MRHKKQGYGLFGLRRWVAGLALIAFLLPSLSHVQDNDRIDDALAQSLGLCLYDTGENNPADAALADFCALCKMAATEARDASPAIRRAGVEYRIRTTQPAHIAPQIARFLPASPRGPPDLLT